MTTTQTTATNAPAWAMPGMQVAYLSGYGGGDGYTLRTVARHTKTQIFLEPFVEGAKSHAFKYGGKFYKSEEVYWTEVGERSNYAATIIDPAGKRAAQIDKANTTRKARAEARAAAEAFLNRDRRWVSVAHAEELQEALGRFITTMTALGEK